MLGAKAAHLCVCIRQLSINSLPVSARNFGEMPGLRLTIPQLQRLCGLEPTECSQVVDALIERSVISRRGAVFFLNE